LCGIAEPCEISLLYADRGRQRKLAKNQPDFAKMQEFRNKFGVRNLAPETSARTATQMLSGIDLFQVAGDRMRYLTERQSLIARNIANADTPGYKAQDLVPFVPATPAGGPTSSGVSPVVLTQTNTAHLQLEAGAVAHQQPVATQADYGGEKPSGNTVSVEEQMIKQADVSNAFAMASAVYAKSISIMKTAVDYGR
jgi:flagellar basal-body rod protein FlgB